MEVLGSDEMLEFEESKEAHLGRKAPDKLLDDVSSNPLMDSFCQKFDPAELALQREQLKQIQQ